MTRTEQALETLTQDSAKRAVKILQKVPLADLCRVSGLPHLVEEYRVSCIYEFIEDNYEFNNEADLEDAAREVFRLIDRYDYTEENALYEVVKERNLVQKN